MTGTVCASICRFHVNRSKVNNKSFSVIFTKNKQSGVRAMKSDYDRRVTDSAAYAHNCLRDALKLIRGTVICIGREKTFGPRRDLNFPLWASSEFVVLDIQLVFIFFFFFSLWKKNFCFWSKCVSRKNIHHAWWRKLPFSVGFLLFTWPKLTHRLLLQSFVAPNFVSFLSFFFFTSPCSILLSNWV